MDTHQQNHDGATVTIPFEKICTIFQIGNPTLYKLTDNNDPSGLGFQAVMGGILTTVGISDGGCFQEGSNPRAQNIRCQYITKENGAFMSAMAYQIRHENDTLQNRFSLIIAQVFF